MDRPTGFSDAKNQVQQGSVNLWGCASLPLRSRRLSSSDTDDATLGSFEMNLKVIFHFQHKTHRVIRLILLDILETMTLTSRGIRVSASPPLSS